MRGTGWAGGLLVLLLAARGAGILPQGREMEQLRLVTALAVDGGEEITVTAVTGVRASEEEEPEVFTGVGENLAEACRALRGTSSRKAYLGQTEQLLVGEGQDLVSALDFVLAHRELRLDTLLYIVRGEAGTALTASASLIGGETGGEDPRGRSVGEVLARLAEGEHVLVPVLAPEENGTLAPRGWAAVGLEGVAAWLDGEAALGADLLSGNGEEQVATLPGGAAELLSVRTWAKEGRVYCTLTARAAEGSPSAEELEKWGEEHIRRALALGLDCWGLDREMAAMKPWEWERWKGFGVEKLQVEVTGRLVTGDERDR